MESFENLAENFRVFSEVLTVDSVSSEIEKIVKDRTIGVVKRTGIVFGAMTHLVKERPDLAKTLIASDTGKSKEEIEKMSEKEMVAPLVRAFMAFVVPFFASEQPPEPTA
jgi:hypothetical protein